MFANEYTCKCLCAHTCCIRIREEREGFIKSSIIFGNHWTKRVHEPLQLNHSLSTYGDGFADPAEEIGPRDGRGTVHAHQSNLQCQQFSTLTLEPLYLYYIIGICTLYPPTCTHTFVHECSNVVLYVHLESTLMQCQHFKISTLLN